MKAIGDKFGWVFPRKERRVLRLLRAHDRECDHEFVTNCPGKAPRRIRTEFAKEELSAFQPHVRHLAKSAQSVNATTEPGTEDSELPESPEDPSCDLLQTA